jgi:hypothetical protein
MMSINLTQKQQSIYNTFIQARDEVGLTKPNFKKHIPHNQVLQVVDVGLNHPHYLMNDDWLHYLTASQDWYNNEPEFRKTERLSAIRGDYGPSDDWEDPIEHDYKEL